MHVTSARARGVRRHAVPRARERPRRRHRRAGQIGEALSSRDARVVDHRRHGEVSPARRALIPRGAGGSARHLRLARCRTRCGRYRRLLRPFFELLVAEFDAVEAAALSGSRSSPTRRISAHSASCRCRARGRAARRSHRRLAVERATSPSKLAPPATFATSVFTDSRGERIVAFDEMLAASLQCDSRAGSWSRETRPRSALELGGDHCGPTMRPGCDGRLEHVPELARSR